MDKKYEVPTEKEIQIAVKQVKRYLHHYSDQITSPRVKIKFLISSCTIRPPTTYSSDPTLPLTFSTLTNKYPSLCSLNTSSTLQSQNLFTCCSLALKHSSPNMCLAHSFISFRSLFNHYLLNEAF